MTKQNKPVVETMINTAALALTSFGVLSITSAGDLTWQCLLKGMIIISFGASLEFVKYQGRKKQLW